MTWRPIETAPKDGRHILVADAVAVSEAKWHDEPGGWWLANSDPTDYWDGQVQPTHWQPMPSPPVTQTGEQP